MPVPLMIIIIIFFVIIVAVIGYFSRKFWMKRWIVMIAIVVILVGSLPAMYLWNMPTHIYDQRDCEPDASKNKVVVVIQKEGIFDKDIITSRISEYFASVKKDLNIDNAGLKKFEGTTIDELDKFVDGLYLDDDVGYIVLVGDDLPVGNTSEEPSSRQYISGIFNDSALYEIPKN